MTPQPAFYNMVKPTCPACAQMLTDALLAAIESELERLQTAAINYGSSPSGFNATANKRFDAMRAQRERVLDAVRSAIDGIPSAPGSADNAVRPTDEKESCVPAVSALPQQELAYLRHEAKKAAVAMAQHMPHRKETHDLYAALTGEATPPPDGLRLLPVEPTPEMVWAGNSLIRYDLDLNGLQTSAAGVWRAMVAALNPPAPRAADNDSPMSDKKDSALPPPPVDQGEQHG